MRGVLCAAPGYLKEEPLIETPLDLLRHDFARYSYYPWGDKWPLMRGNECFEIALNPVLKTNSVHLLLEFARAGAGVVYLPTMVAAADLLEHRLERVSAGVRSAAAVAIGGLSRLAPLDHQGQGIRRLPARALSARTAMGQGARHCRRRTTKQRASARN